VNAPAEFSSTHAFAQTVERLDHRLREAGNTIFATIDQTAAAASAGLALRPTVLVIFGNPAAGTGLMQSVPHMALALPLKAVVWEENGRAHIGYEPLAPRAEHFGASALVAKLEAMDARVAALLAGAAGMG